MANPDTTPGTPRLLRSINDRSALELLLEHGPLTRTRIGALTGLSKPTASQLVDRLLTADLIVPAGTAAGGPGPSAQLYSVNPSAGHAGGVDVTHTRVTAALADLAGEVVGEFEVPVVGRSAAGSVERVRDALHGAAEAAGVAPESVRHVVIGVPGAPHPQTGQLGFARDLPGWHGGNLGRLRELLGVRVEVENDVNLAAIAEQHLGQARGADDFVVFWMGNGIGLAIVQDGRFVRGATGGAGEIGYMPVALDPQDPLARSSKPVKNTFQNIAGRPAVLQLAREQGIRVDDHAEAVRRAVETGNTAMLTTLAQRTARGLAPVLAVLDPSLVVLSGGTLRAGGDLLKDLITHELHAVAVPRPTLAVSTVEGNPVLAGAIHAALRTVREDLFNRGV
ncbi:ROK family transcriptional regulator [Catenulispora rubra]|uniref:ROK family transcriptional regulator n=1 Tax=Catenulispora rubra TaxID=280293 RepID=UPI00189231A9|nr:ROK family transcriptional regulator [Catenulispora rubra]